MAKDDDDFDFGFSFTTEEELDTVKRQQEDKMALIDKCDLMFKAILPLLNNLKQHPEKDIINWPGKDRVQKIDAFIEKLKRIYN